MNNRKHLFTSESVSMGHPDKVADQVSDGVLDAIYEQDPGARVACETLVKTNYILMAGEITTNAQVDYEAVARRVCKRIGYTDESIGFDYKTCEVETRIEKQSSDISQGVTAGDGLHKDQGAGDQGMMFGFACNETPELMPMPIMLAHRLVRKLAELREDGTLPYLRPDGKSQVSVEYDGKKPVRVTTAVISNQHSADVSLEKISDDVIAQVIKAVIPADMLDDSTVYHVNPTGAFVRGGPHGDCGLTGRKIIVDTYGGRGRHGGGAFSGKDPSKVDRSAAYACRHIAKNVVAAGLADICEVQVSYAIGVAKPLSVYVDTEGTNKIDEDKIASLVEEHFDLRPRAIIEYYDLFRPIYELTAYHGHFGRSEDSFTWEKTEKADALRKAAGL